MKIQYTGYGVTVWSDNGKSYTAATEEEAREMLEEDSGTGGTERLTTAEGLTAPRCFSVCAKRRSKCLTSAAVAVYNMHNGGAIIAGRGCII